LVDGSLESPCRVLVEYSWTSFLRRYKAKGVKTRCYQEGVGQLERRFQGEGVVPWEYFLVCTSFAIRQYKLHRATCRCFDTIPACDGRTDRQMELP